MASEYKELQFNILSIVLNLDSIRENSFHNFENQ